MDPILCTVLPTKSRLEGDFSHFCVNISQFKHNVASLLSFFDNECSHPFYFSYDDNKQDSTVSITGLLVLYRFLIKNDFDVIGFISRKYASKAVLLQSSKYIKASELLFIVFMFVQFGVYYSNSLI